MDADYLVMAGLQAFILSVIGIVMYARFGWKYITKITLLVLPMVGLVAFFAFCVGKIGIKFWNVTFFLVSCVTVVVMGLGAIMRVVTKPIEKVSAVIKDMAEAKGDLKTRLPVTFRDEAGEIASGINSFMDDLCTTISEVVNGIHQLAAASREIVVTNGEMVKGTSALKNQTAEVATAVEEMAASVFEVAKNASNASDRAGQAMEYAKKGGEVVTQTIEGIEKIAAKVVESASSIGGLGRKAHEIGEIIRVVDDIADQTNLLALNAAIEAARAGEQGRGFAVVADEVRKLAERTTRATKEVSATLKAIQEETSMAVTSMESGSSDVEKGVSLVNQSGEALREIIEGAKKITDLVSQIVTAAEQQSQATDEIARSVEGISTLTQRTATSAEEGGCAVQALSSCTDELERLVGKFKL
ncbi:MAG: methyl-accepting chemotaxis protein [Pseudomonadota bacterium]